MTRVGIDIDGVVYDFQHAFRQYLSNKLGVSPSIYPEAETWLFFEEQWGMSLDEYLKWVHQGVNDYELFWRGKQIPWSVYGVSELYMRGYEIVFITARGGLGMDEQCRRATEYWIGAQGYPYHEIILSEDKTMHDIDILIDDSPENYQARVQQNQSSLIFDQKWNRHLTDAPRAAGWFETVKYIQENFER